MGANAQTSVPTFTASQVLTAAQMNESARTGVPVFATTTTRDAAFGGTGEKTLAEGQTCYIEAAPKRLQIYNGTTWVDYDAEWTSFTPTITQSATITKTTNYCKYTRIGKTVVVNAHFTLTSAGTAGNVVTVGVPLTAVGVAGTLGLSSGAGYFYDASTTIWYVLAVMTGSTVFSFGADATGANSFGAVPAVTIANGDVLSFSATYEAS